MFKLSKCFLYLLKRFLTPYLQKVKLGSEKDEKLKVAVVANKFGGSLKEGFPSHDL